jgi:hypothetical protein
MNSTDENKDVKEEIHGKNIKTDYEKGIKEIQKHIELVLQFVILGLAMFGLGATAYEAREQKKYGKGIKELSVTTDIRTAAFAIQAGFLGSIIIFMIAMPFKVGRITFAPDHPSWSFPVIALSVISVLAFYIILKLTILERVDNVDETATYLLQEMKTFKEVLSGSYDANVFSIQHSKSEGFSISMWIGLSRTQTLLQTKDEDGYRIPLFIRGIPKTWHVDGKPRPIALIKSPLIYLVLNHAKNPYFEVEFNHMELDTVPYTYNNLISCKIIDKFTAKCKFFDGDTTELEPNELLLVNTLENKEEKLHHVVFVFKEVYKLNMTSNKKELFTEINIYIDGKLKDTNHFAGQFRHSSSYVSMINQGLFDYGDTIESLGDILSASKMCDARFFSYPLEEGRVSSLYTDGYRNKKSK